MQVAFRRGWAVHQATMMFIAPKAFVSQAYPRWKMDKMYHMVCDKQSWFTAITLFISMFSTTVQSQFYHKSRVQMSNSRSNVTPASNKTYVIVHRKCHHYKAGLLFPDMFTYM